MLKGTKTSAEKKIIREENVHIEKNAWALQAMAIEEIQKEVDNFNFEIERLSHGFSNYESKSRGEIIMLKEKVTHLQRTGNLNRNILRQIEKEAWVWSFIMSATVGVAIGLYTAIISRVI